MSESSPPIARPRGLPDLEGISAPGRFARGLTYPLRGLAFLWKHTDLWGWAAAPLLITAWMIAGALYLTVWYADDVIALLWARPDGAAAPAATALWWFGVRAIQLAVFLLLGLFAFVLGNIVASPFWDVLAERAEQKLLDRPETPFDWRIVLGDAFMSIRHSILGMLVYVGVMGPLFLINLVPGVGSVVYTACSYPLTAFFVARELMDIPLSRRRTPFREKLRWMRGHKALLAGVGTSGMLLLAVPFLNLVFMPMAVMGGTLLYCHLHEQDLGVPQRGPAGRLLEANGV